MNLSNLYKSIALEILAITSILFTRNFYSVFVFFSLHFIASFLISQVLILLLPSNYKRNKFTNLIFFTIFNWITLFLGYLASLYLVIIFLKKIKFTPKYDIKTINYSLLLTFPKTQRLIGEGSANLDFSKASKEIKMNLLKTFNQEITTVSVRLIKNLLMDSDGEIRLYSFQTLNKIRNELSQKINDTITELKNLKENMEKANANKKLATYYFDMFEIEVSEESLKPFFMEKSLYHIKEAENILGDGELLFIKGKIYKAKGDYEQALDFFDLALKYNFDEHKVLPLIAEIYYEKQDYYKVKQIFKKDYSLKLDLNTSQIYEIWEGV